MTSTFVDKSGRGVLLAALNKAAATKGFSFAPTDLNFGPVEASSNPARQNQVIYTATADSQYEGSQVAYYDRLDLTQLFVSAGIVNVELTQGASTTGDVVAALNARFGLGFTAEDIDFNVAVDPAATSVILQALEGSYGFQGQLEIQLVEGSIPLAEVVVDPVLDGPEYPAPVPAYIIDPVIVTGELTLKGQKADGTMLNGSGNPSTEFTVANNGELELAVSARIWKSGVLPVPEAGHYSIEIAENGDWNWPFSVALLSESRPVTDLYDVVLSITSLETGVALPFQLVRDAEGKMHFINEQHGLDISDSAVTASGDVVQNIQRATFYKAQLGEMTTNTLGSPIGDFLISLNAVRREGLVQPLQVEISVSVSVPGSEPV